MLPRLLQGWGFCPNFLPYPRGFSMNLSRQLWQMPLGARGSPPRDGRWCPHYDNQEKIILRERIFSCDNLTKIYFSARWLVRADLQNRDTRLLKPGYWSRVGTSGFSSRNGTIPPSLGQLDHCKSFREARGHAPPEKIRNLRSSNCWKSIQIVDPNTTTLISYHFKSFTIPSGGPVFVILALGGGGGGLRAHPAHPSPALFNNWSVTIAPQCNEHVTLHCHHQRQNIWKFFRLQIILSDDVVLLQLAVFIDQHPSPLFVSFL